LRARVNDCMTDVTLLHTVFAIGNSGQIERPPARSTFDIWMDDKFSRVTFIVYQTKLSNWLVAIQSDLEANHR
jgi:hypothetical protein